MYDFRENSSITNDVASTGIPISEDSHIPVVETKRELNLLNLSILFPNSKV